jgi:hypothetical protein
MVSAARHANRLPAVAVVNERPGEPSNVIPLLILVMGLAVATMWFVALPALNKPARAERSCEVFVLKSGSTRCVAKPVLGSRATPQKPKTATRPKH